MERARVLLVMPRTGYLWDEWATPPIGIAYVSSYLKANGVIVYTVNMNLEDEDTYTVLQREIEAHDINIIGTGELVVNYEKLQKIVSYARKIKPEVRIWIGGGLVTNSPKEAMELIPEADFGMIGEGELTSYELIRLLESTKGRITEEIKKIKGLVIRKENGSLVYTPPREPISNLDSLPFPDWEGFRLSETCQKYAKGDGAVVSSIVSSRSCPNSCTFCSKSGGKNYRKRSLDNIFEEIDYLVNQFHVKRINFNDELFADRTDRLYQFCDRIEKYHISYRVSMHISKNLTVELLTRMRESGCQVIFYGLESADNDVLKSMRKHITIEEIEHCLTITKKAGITVEGNFIFGDTIETTESIRHTLEWIQNHYYMGIFEVAPIKLYPGSQLYEDAVDSGKIKDTTQFIKEKCPLVNVSKLSEAEYDRLINHDLTVIQKMRIRDQEGVMIENRGLNLNGSIICSSCGNKIKFQIQDTSQILRMYTHRCDKCNSLEYINFFPKYYSKVAETIRYMLRTKRVAVFGCGNIWKLFYMGGDVFLDDNYILIDETPFLQGYGWNGRSVFSPAVIKEKRIEIVISMIRSSKKEIEEKLEKDYGIYDVTVLPCYDLMCWKPKS